MLSCCKILVTDLYHIVALPTLTDRTIVARDTSRRSLAAGGDLENMQIFSIHDATDALNANIVSAIMRKFRIPTIAWSPIL
jgi:hypothetical protein